MAYQPANPFPKSRGDTIRSQDWNDAVREVQRLDTDKVNRGGGDAITGSLTVSGNMGVGTTNPGAKVHVAGGSIRWGNNSELVADQGGSLELGGNNSTAGTGSPYIDFHFSGQTQDFNTRIINDANGRLSLMASTLQATGNVGIGTASPQRALSVNAALNVDQANANGGAVNPGITFGSNSGEGIASKRTAGGNQAGLDLYTNNAARLSITSVGNVGIGTAAPGARLDISGSGGAVQCCAPVAPTLSLAEASSSANRQSWLQFHNVNEAEAYIRLAGGGASGSGREGTRRLEIGDTQTGSANLTVQGRVGVGTTTPAERLHVEGGNIQVRQFPANDTTPSLTSLQLVNRGTGGTPLSWSLYTAAVGGGHGVNPNSFEIWEYPATNSRFQIRPGGNTVLVPAGGNVGIGAPSSGAKLQVSDGAIMPATGNSATAGIQFPSDPGGGAFDQAYIRYFAETGETTRLVIGIENDPDDRISLRQMGADRLTISNGRVGVGIQDPSQALEVNGGLRASGPILFPKTNGGDAELANYQGGFLDTAAGAARLRMGHQPLDTPVPTYLFGVGHSATFRFFSGVVTAFQTKFSINQNGEAYFAGAKSGYVVDHFINSVGDTLEQGDVVVIGSTDASRYSGTDNNIPLVETDLTDKAYDARVCGIVASVVTENDLPYVEVQAPDVEEVARDANATEAAVQRALELGVNPFELEGTGSGGRVLVTDIESAAEQGETPGTNGAPEGLETYVNPLAQFAGEVTLQSDVTMIEDQQMGRMVTLGAFAHCKVDADIAPISAGDLLTTSPTKGHAQKVLEPERAAGAIVGKALASLRGGRGKIPVLVMLQ